MHFRPCRTPIMAWKAPGGQPLVSSLESLGWPNVLDVLKGGWKPADIEAGVLRAVLPPAWLMEIRLFEVP